MAVTAMTALGSLVWIGCTPKPQPGTKIIVGDSITMAAAVYGDLPLPPGIISYVGFGFSVDGAPGTQPDGSPNPTPQEWLSARVKEKRPEIFISALGTNDAHDSLGYAQWDAGDVARFRTFLNTPHPSACVAVVTPAVAEGQSPDYAAAMAQARLDIMSLAEERAAKGSPTVILDWQAIVDEHPEYIQGGVHLATTPLEPRTEAANARRQVYIDGFDQCQDLLDQATTTTTTTTEPTTTTDRPTEAILHDASRSSPCCAEHVTARRRRRLRRGRASPTTAPSALPSLEWAPRHFL